MTKRKKILIVDDDAVFKLIAKKMFERSGDLFEVTFAENGLEAINLLTTLINENSVMMPDIILLDIEMPIMNGWDFMEAFKKLPSETTDHICIYTVSSSIAPEDRHKTASYPQIKDYITKPLTVDIIRHIAAIF